MVKASKYAWRSNANRAPESIDMDALSLCLSSCASLPLLREQPLQLEKQSCCICSTKGMGRSRLFQCALAAREEERIWSFSGSARRCRVPYALVSQRSPAAPRIQTSDPVLPGCCSCC